MNDTPTYRIQTVSELTGVPAPTLRAWERRYGVPSPSRTRASYRLYSEEDVEQVRRMRNLIEQGIAPAEAARALQAGPAPTTHEAAEEDDPWEIARQSLLGAVERFDPEALEDAVRRALILGSASDVFQRVLAPVQVEVGERWERGEVSVAQEHFASEVIERASRELLRLIQPEEGSRLALLACFPDETHTLPLYGAALRLAQWGFRTIVLGRRTPPAALDHAAKVLEPDFVGLSVTIAPETGEARHVVGAYAKAVRGRLWAVGGAASESLSGPIKRRGGIVAGRDLDAFKVELERALARARRAS